MITPGVLGTGQVEESFKYYVAEGGSDSNPGTKKEPFLTVDKAVGLLAEGQGVGVKKGGKYRLTPAASEPLTNASLKITHAANRIGPYGPGTSRPILTPAKVISPWTAETTGGLEPTLGSATGAGEGEAVGITIAPSGGLTPESKQNKGAWANALTVTATLTSTPTVGRTLIAICGYPSSRTLTPPTGFTTVVEAKGAKRSIWIGRRTVVEGDGKVYVGTLNTSERQAIAVTELANYGGIDAISAAKFEAQSPYVMPSLGPTQEKTLAIFAACSNNGTATFVPTVPAGYTEIAFAQGEFCPLFTFSQANPSVATASGVYSAAVTGQRPSLLTYDLGAGPVLLNETTGTPAAGNWSYSSEVALVRLPGNKVPGSEATMEAAVSNALLNSASNVRINGMEFRHAFDHAIWSKKRGLTITNCKAQFCSSAGNGGVFYVYGETGSEGTGFSRLSRLSFANNLNDGIWFGVLKDCEIDFITGEKFDQVERQNGVALASDVVQLSINQGGNVGRLKVHDVFGNVFGALSPKGITIFHGDGDPATPKEGEVTVERIFGIAGNFGATAGMPAIKIKDCFFYWISATKNWGGPVTSNEIDGHISNVEISEILGVGPAPNNLGFGNGVAFEDGESWQHGVNIHDNLFVNCGWTFLTLNSAELDGFVERNRMAIIEAAPAPAHGHIGVKHGPAEGKTLTINNNVYPSEFTNAFRGPAANYSTLSAWTAGTGYDANSKVEALNESTVLSEIEAKVNRLSKRITGKTMTYAELKTLVGA